MSEYLEKDVVYINSINRSGGTSSAFYIDISQQLRTPNNYDSIVLTNAYIPKSYYLITSANNTFTISETGYAVRTITIPSGSYSLPLMVSTLTTQINAASLHWTYTISISTQTGLITFTNNATAGNGASFNFSGLSPYRILGFGQTTYNMSYVNNVFTLTSPNVINLQLTSTINVMCDVVDKQLLSLVIPSEMDFSSILYTERNPQFVSKSLIRSNCNNLYFWLLDGNTGQPINLNGLDVQFTVVFYKRNDYFNIMIADHSLKLLQEDYERKAQLEKRPDITAERIN